MTTYRYDIEYLKWLVRSLEFVSQNLDTNEDKIQNAVDIISNTLHKKLAVCYEMLISSNEPFTKDGYKTDKEESHKKYLENCDKFCKCFNFNVKPCLVWGDTEEEDKKQFTVDDARIVAYDTIQNYQKKIIALYMVANSCSSCRAVEAKNILHEKLYNKLNHAYGIYFMFALGGDDCIIKTAKQIAYDRFLSKKMAIMAYQNTGFGYSGSHWMKDEETFSEDIKKKYL